MAVQLGWKIKLNMCIGCESCTVACKAENNTAPGSSPVLLKGGKINAKQVNYRDVVFKHSGTYGSTTNPVSLTFITSSCNHCKDPACMAACPVDAISKDENYGVVLIDQDKCIGCKYCVWTCPYGAPKYNEDTKKVEKCTFCWHRIYDSSAGQLTDLKPACMTTCVGKALEWNTDFNISNSGKNKPNGFADPALTNPSIEFETG